jgi:hypothetical protein
MSQNRRVGRTLLHVAALLLIGLLLAACQIGASPAKPGTGEAVREAVAPAGSTPRPARPTSIREQDFDLARALPVGTLTVDIMELAASPRVDELTKKLQLAVAENQEWWQEYLQEHAEERPLPYHPNMGLSEAEYEEFLAQADELSVAKTGEATLQVRASVEGLLVLDGGEELPELTGLTFDLERNVLETPYGTTTDYETLHPRKSALGSWDGVQWSLEDAESTDIATMTATVAKLALGTLKESGRQVLYYDVKRVEDGAAVEQITIILYYDLPGTSDTDQERTDEQTQKEHSSIKPLVRSVPLVV